MFFRALVVGCAFTCLAYVAGGAERFPYSARVAEKADVRSGPGERFAATGTLREGDEVEVYRHDPGDWCAIRPPEGSSSWVFGDELQLLNESLAEVTVDGAKAFVGGRSARVRDVSHVALRRGERVQVLGSALEDGTWYKIAPPSGEFRWIHRRHLRDPAKPPKPPQTPAPRKPENTDKRDDSLSHEHTDDPHEHEADVERKDEPGSQPWRAAPADVAVPQSPVGKPADGTSAAQRGVGYRPAESRDANHLPESVPETGWRPPGAAPRTTRTEQTNVSFPHQGKTMEHITTQGNASPEASSDARLSSDIPDNSPVNARLDRLELAVSAMVCQPKERWAFDELRERTKTALRQAAAPVERGRARRLLERIARFEDVQRKSLGWDRRPISGPLGPTAPPTTTVIGSTADAAAPRDESPAPQRAPEDPRFDGSGRLVVLQKRDDKDPQYLLVDELGVTKYFVTAAPGVNLRSYLDRTIGITGTRAEDPALGRPHIVAQRVTVLR